MAYAGKAVEQAARDSYGRLLAFLASRSRDLAAAEDALGDALVSALERWPVDGVPRNPDAWLLTVARRKALDRRRHAMVIDAAAEPLRAAQEEAEALMNTASDFPDERLKLLFVCAHPAIDAAARTPLMLQVVLGVDAARIASAFLVSPAAMTKRLTRTKAKIRDAGIAFELPDPAELDARLGDVLAAVYAAFSLGWEDPLSDEQQREGLTGEAIWMARLLERLLPEQPEAKGLIALMLFCEARRPARRTQDGRYVALLDQDVALWSADMIDTAETLLRRAGRTRRPGRYQLEAAIQAVHAAKRATGWVDWEAIVVLYEGLAAMSPTVGALVGRAAALCEAGAPADALAALDALAQGPASSYQPYWATRAHVLERLGSTADAALALTSAIGLTEDSAVRRYLVGRRKQLSN